MEYSSDSTVGLFCVPKDIFKAPSKICISDCKKRGTVNEDYSDPDRAYI